MKQSTFPSWKPPALAGPSPAGVERSGTRPRPPEEEIPCTSFEEVVRRHASFVMEKVVVRLSSEASRSLRDDIFQEVFAKAGRRFRGREGIPHPVTDFLARLVASEVRIQTRRRARDRLTGDPDEEAAPASKPDPEQLCARYEEEAERRRLVEAALQAMRPESAIMIELADIEGRPYEEIAREIGCTSLAVKLRVLRARAQFSKVIHDLRSKK
jgi:RNA polymerase sigma-70 factor (ECF subfamily)